MPQEDREEQEDPISPFRLGNLHFALQTLHSEFLVWSEKYFNIFNYGRIRVLHQKHSQNTRVNKIFGNLQEMISFHIIQTEGRPQKRVT